VTSEKRVQSVESAFGENNQSSEMSTWSKLDDVESANVASVNSWKVSSGLLDSGALISIDDEWSLSHDILGASVLGGSASKSSV